LIADEEDTGRLLLLRELLLRHSLLLGELQICQACTDQHGGAAEQLTDRFAEIVFNIGARLRVTNCEFRRSICRFGSRHQNHQSHKAPRSAANAAMTPPINKGFISAAVCYLPNIFALSAAAGVIVSPLSMQQPRGKSRRLAADSATSAPRPTSAPPTSTAGSPSRPPPTGSRSGTRPV
jgi:hypothetical protein